MKCGLASDVWPTNYFAVDSALPPTPKHDAIDNMTARHEYLHGIDDVLSVYAKSPVPLLVDEGRVLEVGSGRLYLAGVDDPIFSPDHAKFFDRSVARGELLSLATCLFTFSRVALASRSPDFSFRAMMTEGLSAVMSSGK